MRRTEPGNRITIWTLHPYKGSFRIVAIRFSKPNLGCNSKLERTKTYDGDCNEDCCWDHTKHLRGIRLSGNRIDRTLLDYCEGNRV